VPNDPLAIFRRARVEALALADRTSGQALYRILKSAETDLAARLETHRALRPSMGKSFTRRQMELTLREIRFVLRSLVDRLGGYIPARAEVAARDASDGVARYLKAAEKQFTGIVQPLALDEAAMSDAAVVGANASVVRRLMVEHPDGKGGGILQRYGFSVAEKFEREMQSALVTRKPWDEVRASFVKASPFLQGAPKYWAERLTRTETFAAYNKGGQEAMKRAHEELGDMVRILVATFDNRTGADSWNVHGEVRGMNEPFEYVNWKGDHAHFMTPPNRPNDREVVVAHRMSWPVPAAFRPKSDADVQREYEKQKLKYHGRPAVMSTSRMPELLSRPSKRYP
jgi:hypothetical protein